MLCPQLGCPRGEPPSAYWQALLQGPCHLALRSAELFFSLLGSGRPSGGVAGPAKSMGGEYGTASRGVAEAPRVSS
jgi:hypothetical protein